MNETYSQIQNEYADSLLGDGYISLSIVYVSFALTNFIAPGVVGILGHKTTMFIAALNYLLYILVFLNPTPLFLYSVSGNGRFFFSDCKNSNRPDWKSWTEQEERCCGLLKVIFSIISLGPSVLCQETRAFSAHFSSAAWSMAIFISCLLGKGRNMWARRWERQFLRFSQC